MLFIDQTSILPHQIVIDKHNITYHTRISINKSYMQRMRQKNRCRYKLMRIFEFRFDSLRMPKMSSFFSADYEANQTESYSNVKQNTKKRN